MTIQELNLIEKLIDTKLLIYSEEQSPRQELYELHNQLEDIRKELAPQ